MKNEIFRMERVTYIDSGNVQLEDFNLQIYEGEIVGMNPINGHGLQEFLQLLQTNRPLYDGYIYYCNEKVNSWKVAKKAPNRIGIIGTKSSLVERMTVLDNIFVLRQGFHQEILQNKLLKQQLQPFLEDIDMDISSDIYVEKLSAFERIVVELLRFVLRGYRLIVLNEIYTLINGEELNKLHKIITHYARKGFSFLYISLHLEELEQISDRVVLFSNGRIQKIVQKPEIEEGVLERYIREFDRMIGYHKQKKAFSYSRERIIMEICEVTGQTFKQMNFSVYNGECLVVQSLDAAVFWELTQILSGHKNVDNGYCCVEGKKVKFSRCRDIAVVAAEPTKNMIFQELSYMDNLCMGLSNRVSNIWMGSRIRKSIKKEYGKILGDNVFLKNMDELTEKEKCQLVYHRIVLQKPKIVFCIQPFKGADFPHRVFVGEMLEMLLEKGMTVIILTMNLADSMSLADRFIRITSDGIMEEIRKDDFGKVLVK